MALPKRLEDEPATTKRSRAQLRVVEEHAERERLERIHRLKEAHLECRTIGHSWRVVYVGPAARADEELATRARQHHLAPDGARVLRCSRCRTERVDLCWIGYGRSSYSYRLVSRYYRYASGYEIEGGLGRSRDHLHEELFRRFETGENRDR